MISSTFVAALATLPLAYAGYHERDNHPTANTTSPQQAVQTVAVGKDGLKFTPDTITAKPGDKITFEFFPKNHTVAQSSFENPCNPVEGGIFSGFNFAVAQGKSDKQFTITVKDDKPVWLYCSAVPQGNSHCAAGMVAVINPPKEGPKNLQAFRQAAASKKNSTTSPAQVNDGSNESTTAPNPTNGGNNKPQNTTTPSVAPSGTPSGTPSASGAPKPTGAASTLVVQSGFVGGLVALFAALML